ncbi:cytochrome c1 [Beijerinckia sp. L45]|uniref:cytochrome c1 n=1 Tax=Beijerinckia sp. L45 TaxID=1641855 RepID=UPI00131B964E|nr:cytochrome c1 [Beijerinckia sp. L45]
MRKLTLTRPALLSTCASALLGLALLQSQAFAQAPAAGQTPGKEAPAAESPAAPKAETNAEGHTPQGANGAPATQKAEEDTTPPPVAWSFTGLFGHFDTAQLQRGFKIYKEVCSNCHAMKYVAFRNLADPGGPEFSESQVKALAASYQIHDGPNDTGEMFDRPGRPSDYFPWAFPNAAAARAALGGLPPDMSVLAKARSWERGFPQFIFDAFTQSEEAEGPTYIHAILNGYTHPDDPNWNLYMPGHKIAMAKPLSDGQVEYTDGSPQTVAQYSQDVAAFLMWVAEPKLEERKATGFRVVIILAVFAGLLFFIKRRIWARVGGDVVVGAP